MLFQKLLSKDPLTGIYTNFFHDHVEDKIHIETVQDVEPLLDQNRREYNAAPERMTGDLHKVASIPMPLYYELQREGIIDDPERFAKWLNDPDNLKFRTRPGRI